MCRRAKKKERDESEIDARERSDRSDLGVTRKERGAMIKAALSTYLPLLFGILACFGIAALAMYLWL